MKTAYVKKKQLPVVVFLSLGYLIAVTIGTILLMLPWATKADTYALVNSFKDFMNLLVNTLLTATSATCVTGIVAYDTFTNWTMFGQIVIIALIQIGGLGFMTIITLIFMIFGKNISLYEKTILMQSAGSYTISDVMKVIRTILIGTLIIEGIGAALLYLRFRVILPANGFVNYSNGQAIYFAIFHSISAFCNAGFDLMGAIAEPMSSFTSLYNDIGINFILIGLIVIGGLGYVVWIDILKNGFHFKKYQLHSKLVLVSNLILVFGGALLYFIFEYTNNSLGSMGTLSLGNKLMASLFMSITPRTAGFNTISMENLTPSSKLLTIVLMFIGGNSGSTAGGVKVTTCVIVLLNLINSAKSSKDIIVFKRKISSGIIKQASALFLSYILVIIAATFLVSTVEGLFGGTFVLEDIIVEITSAICTVGICIMSLAETTMFTRIILLLLMYLGRLGAFTLFDLLVKDVKDEELGRPEGNVLVG